jgi:methenyltetrahydrofolate cyclohydrolase
MTLADKSLSTVLEEFRSSSPSPGGGSAAALAGALGASLLAMVAGLPRPRATTDDESRRLRAAGERCAALARTLEALIERDSDAYTEVMSAYRLPKGTDEEKAARVARIDAALKGAIETPLEVMRSGASAMAEGDTVLALGNANASSDVKVGLELLRAGLRGAHLNVAINLDGLKDRVYAERAAAEAARLLGSANERSE